MWPCQSVIGLELMLIFHSKLYKMSNCSDVLQQGIFNKYGYTNKSEYQSKLKTLFSYDYDHLKTLETSNDGKIKLLAGKFGSLSGNTENSRKEYESIREKFLKTQDQELTEKLAVEINSLIASPEILDAWKACMLATYGNSSNLSVSPDARKIGTFQNPTQEFLIVFRYVPTANEDPEYLVAKGLSIAGDAELVMHTPSETIRPEDRVMRHGVIIQKARRTGRGAISIAISLQGRSVPIVEIPEISDNRPPIPSTLPISKSVNLFGSGYWHHVRGDTEMDTGGRDVVPVVFSSNLMYNENEVWIDYYYEQRETGGDKTTYKGSHRDIIYKQYDSNFKIKGLIHDGSSAVNILTQTIGKQHQFNSFKIFNSYLKDFEFRVDGGGRDDNRIIGIRGKVELSIAFDRR